MRSGESRLLPERLRRGVLVFLTLCAPPAHVRRPSSSEPAASQCEWPPRSPPQGTGGPSCGSTSATTQRRRASQTPCSEIVAPRSHGIQFGRNGESHPVRHEYPPRRPAGLGNMADAAAVDTGQPVLVSQSPSGHKRSSRQSGCREGLAGMKAATEGTPLGMRRGVRDGVRVRRPPWAPVARECCRRIP